MKVLKNWQIYPMVYFKLVRNPYVFFITKNDLKLKIRTGRKSSDIHVFSEIWLDDVYLKNFKLRQKGIIIDVGSHIGLFSLLCSQKYPQSKIYSFEPEIENFKIQQNNIQINRIHNIFPNNFAVSNVSGNIEFYLNEDDYAGHSLIKNNGKKIIVKSVTLEDVFKENEIENCELLKLDCEGTEYDIIMNLNENFLNRIKNICIEYENLENVDYALSDLIEKLQSNRFLVKLHKITNNNGYLYAKKLKQ